MPYKMIVPFSNSVLYCTIFSFLTFSACTNKQNNTGQQDAIFAFDNNADTRWSSPENRNGLKGAGGKENNSAKGHAYDAIKAGESYTLLETEGPGIVNRIWVTINDRSPLMLRSLRLNMYWDGESKPAVSIPFGDFFGVGLGKTSVFENALFANPEGRSFLSLYKCHLKSLQRSY